ncbi:MAG: hypothetical protein GVY12_12725 [Bacteroidetes bacterium]|jgi:cell division septum initiation protein DivIVA|nr:hypothetical protein [Bacteroidota bacterium]
MEAFFTFLASYWWILFIFAGMGYSAFDEWLDFKKEQRKLGASTEAMGDDLEALRDEWKQERARLTRRIEHLEAIVTSQTWDALHGDALPEGALHDHAMQDHAMQDGEAAPPLNHATPPPSDATAPVSDAERAERIAQRIR